MRRYGFAQDLDPELLTDERRQVLYELLPTAAASTWALKQIENAQPTKVSHFVSLYRQAGYPEAEVQEIGYQIAKQLNKSS